jgi:hypothetical protein
MDYLCLAKVFICLLGFFYCFYTDEDISWALCDGLEFLFICQVLFWLLLHIKACHKGMCAFKWEDIVV